MQQGPKGKSNSLANKSVRILFVQFVVSVVISSGLWLFEGGKPAYSALLGGMTCVLSNAYFAKKLFSVTGAQAAQKIVANFYIAELVKVLITIILFIICFKFLAISALPFFLTYIIAQMAFWLAPFLMRD